MEDQKTLPKVLSPVKSPKRINLPDERESTTHKFTIIGGWKEIIEKDGKFIEQVVDVDGYVTAGFYPDGKLGEIFLSIGKQGGPWKVYDMLMIAVSVGLQYGIPLQVFLDKFEHQRFEPAGITKNPNIGIAKSIPDYLARWLKKFLPISEDEDGSSGFSEGDTGGQG